MSFHHDMPCIMTTTEQFYVRLCSCGVVHLNFGYSVVNVSPEAAIAITETLKELSSELRKRVIPPKVEEKEEEPGQNNLIVGKFPGLI